MQESFSSHWIDVALSRPSSDWNSRKIPPSERLSSQRCGMTIRQSPALESGTLLLGCTDCPIHSDRQACRTASSPLIKVLAWEIFKCFYGVFVFLSPLFLLKTQMYSFRTPPCHLVPALLWLCHFSLHEHKSRVKGNKNRKEYGAKTSLLSTQPHPLIHDSTLTCPLKKWEIW